MAARENELLAMEFEGLMGWLRKLPEAVDVEQTLKVADGLRLQTATLLGLYESFDAEEKAGGRPGN